MSLADLTTASVGEVAALPVSVHAALVREYAALQARAKRIGAVLDAALSQVYGGQNDAGTFHSEREGFDIKVTVPKRVKWSQSELEDMTADDALGEWIDWKPSVSEARYKAAPQRIRDALDEARTVEFGRPTIEFKRKEG